MSDIIETIKQSAGQILSGLDEKGQIKSALEGIRSQWNELERRRKMSALRNEIKTAQGEMKQLTEALGLQALSLYEAGKIVHPELSRLCQRINELRSEIEQKKTELDELKAQAQVESVKCPKCQTDVPADAEFCPKCGAQIQESVGKLSARPVAGSPAAAAAQPRTVVRLRCPRCKTILSAEDEFCPTCGVKIQRPQQGSQQRSQPPAAPASSRFCPSCGAQTNPNARFCPICGQAIP